VPKVKRKGKLLLKKKLVFLRNNLLIRDLLLILLLRRLDAFSVILDSFHLANYVFQSLKKVDTYTCAIFKQMKLCLFSKLYFQTIDFDICHLVFTCIICLSYLPFSRSFSFVYQIDEVYNSDHSFHCSRLRCFEVSAPYQ
jgi:hypothetical protein